MADASMFRMIMLKLATKIFCFTHLYYLASSALPASQLVIAKAQHPNLFCLPLLGKLFEKTTTLEEQLSFLLKPLKIMLTLMELHDCLL
jgi:hypothetical protein